MHACAQKPFQERGITGGRDFNRVTARGACRAPLIGRERVDKGILVGEVFTAHVLPANSREPFDRARPQAADRLDRTIHLLGGLVEGPVLPVNQDDHPDVIGRQPPESVSDGLCLFAFDRGPTR